MSKNNGGFVGWAGLVLAILAIACVAFMYVSSHSSADAGAGSAGGPTFNAGAIFPVGLQLGVGTNANLNEAIIQIQRGQNQASWKNTTGRTVYMLAGDIEMGGIASGTIAVSVGTTTAASTSVIDNFSVSTAPIWSRFIDATSISTSSQLGVIADNIANHKTSYPGMVPVLDGQKVWLVAESLCKTTGGCETATSSNRGFTTLTMPFYYRF